MNSKNVFIVVAVIVVIAAGGFFLNSHKPAADTSVKGVATKASISKQLPSPTNTISPQPSLIISPSGDSIKNQYKDGTYEVMGNYQSPGGAEQIDVKITLKNSTISDVNVTSEATRPMSKRFQGIFIDNYKTLVIGKSIDDVHLDKVSGSSLTPQGFNDAIDQIKQQAKA
jgi:uncharacterized protein with FMN-binding domain